MAGVWGAAGRAEARQGGRAASREAGAQRDRQALRNCSS